MRSMLDRHEGGAVRRAFIPSSATLRESHRGEWERARASLLAGEGTITPAGERGGEASGAGAVGALALGALAVGAVALGAVAVGTIAVGAFALGRLALGRAEVVEADIERLRIGTLEIGDIVRPAVGRDERA